MNVQNFVGFLYILNNAVERGNIASLFCAAFKSGVLFGDIYEIPFARFCQANV